ncbi:retrovirus-related pol polyprotein from transposon TNT 1-94 [Tanacetum coccineum]
MTTLAGHMIVADADTVLLCLKRQCKTLGRIVLDGVTRTKTYEELMDTENLQDDCDVRAINIVLQGLPPDVYSLVNHHEQERESKLYNEFDRFISVDKKLSAEKAFWLSILNPMSKQLVVPPTPVKIEVPNELPKDFDNGLHNEVNEVKTVFNQMEADVNSVLITPAASSNKKNKSVEVHPRKVMSSSNKRDHVSMYNANFKHAVKDMNSKFVCLTSNGCLFSANLDKCVAAYRNDVNKRVKSKSGKSKKMEWKPTGKVFTSVRHRWLPTGRTFTINGTKCHMTIITSNPIMPPKETSQTLIITPNPEVKVYRRRTKVEKSVSFSHPNCPLVLGLGMLYAHDQTMLSAHQLCSKDTNLYTLSIDDMMRPSPVCLLSKASKTMSWKSKKHTHKPKSEDFIQEKLYLLHMDLCGPIRIKSINGKKYILVIVDDYSRFTWVKFLRSKDEPPDFVIKFLKMIQVRLNAIVRNICTDNGTDSVNQTLKSYYEDAEISHQTSVARTP